MSALPPLREPRPRPSAERGVALLIVLAFVVMMTVLVAGFALSMRLERQASNVDSNAQRAELATDSAVAHAVGILAANVPDPTPLSATHANAPAQLWHSNPGRLTLVSAGRTVDLHSGAATSASDADSVDLNKPLPGSAYPLIAAGLDAAGAPDLAAARPVMRVKWVNLLRDASQPASRTNPIVGRYAFWVDDESTKLNFNTAYGKPASILTDPNNVSPTFKVASEAAFNSVSFNAFTLGQLPSVNLDALASGWKPIDAAGKNLAQMVYQDGAYRSPDAIQQFAPGSTPLDKEKWYQAHKFLLTHYNRAPEFNAFGLSRIFPVSNTLALEVGPQHQFPVKVGSTPHNVVVLGSANSASKNSLDEARNTLLTYLKRTDWPGGHDGSFEAKYGAANAEQLALDLVGMMRLGNLNIQGGGIDPTKPEESRRVNQKYYLDAWSDSLPGLLNTSTITKIPNDYLVTLTSNAQRTLPQEPPPHLNEIAVTFTAVPVANPNPTGQYWIQFKIQGELYEPPYGPQLKYFTATPPDQYASLSNHLQLRVASLQLDAVNPFNGAKRRLDVTELANPKWNADNPSGGAHLAGYGAIPHTELGNAYRYAVLDFPVSWTGAPPATTIPPTPAVYHGAYIPGPAVETVNDTTYTDFPLITAAGASGDPLPRYDPQSGKTAVFKAGPGGNAVSLAGKLRVGLALPKGGRPLSVVPLQPNATLDFSGVSLDLVQNQSVTVSFEIEDPRLYGRAANWVQTSSPTLGAVNSNQGKLATAGSKLRYLANGPLKTSENRSTDEFQTFGFSSIGLLSLLSPGIQSNDKWASLDFGAGGSASPPDWLLLDLIGPNFRATNDQWASGAGSGANNKTPDKWSASSFMNSTAGRVNLNTRIFPQNSFFTAPPRKVVTQALFKNLVPDADLATLATAFEDAQGTTGFAYVGEATRVPGFLQGAATTPAYARESLLRHMASCMTTQSNTFGVYGAGQAIKKKPGNVDYGKFERGDVVLAEKRFYCLLERAVWTGIDGVPGNGSVDANGAYDKLAKPTPAGTEYDRTIRNIPGSSPPLGVAGMSWAPIDGPRTVTSGISGALQPPDSGSNALSKSYNPADPLMRYRPVYFKYFD